MKNAHSCLRLMEESEEKFRKIAENSLVSMFMYKEFFVYVNDTLSRMTGYTKEELLQMHPWDLVDAKHRESFKHRVQERLSGKKFKAVYNDALLINKEGVSINVKISAETISYRSGYAGIGIGIDITDIVKKNQVIKVLIQALSQSDDIVFITDVAGKIKYANKALNNLYGYADDEVIGKTPALFRSGVHNRKFYDELWKTILSGKNYNRVVVNKKQNGAIVYMDTKITPVEDDSSGKISYFVVSARDMTKRVLIEKKLEKLATTDPLTHISNRYQILHYFDDFIARAKRASYPFSVLFFDIDFFKCVNDTYGHYVGDIILKEFTELIMANIRNVDKFGRWGGEEFILLLDGTKRQEAFCVAQKLRKKVENYHFNNSYNITVSIGALEYKMGDSKDFCLDKADKALYRAKKNGRNRIVMYEEIENE